MGLRHPVSRYRVREMSRYKVRERVVRDRFCDGVDTGVNTHTLIVLSRDLCITNCATNCATDYITQQEC